MMMMMRFSCCCSSDAARTLDSEFWRRKKKFFSVPPFHMQIRRGKSNTQQNNNKISVGFLKIRVSLFRWNTDANLHYNRNVHRIYLRPSTRCVVCHRRHRQRHHHTNWKSVKRAHAKHGKKEKWNENMGDVVRLGCGRRCWARKSQLATRCTFSSVVISGHIVLSHYGNLFDWCNDKCRICTVNRRRRVNLSHTRSQYTWNVAQWK